MQIVAVGSRQDPHIRRVSQALRGRDITLFMYEMTSGDQVCGLLEGEASDRVTFSAGDIERSITTTLDVSACVFWFRDKSRLDVVGNRDQQLTYFRIAERRSWITGSIRLTGATHFNNIDATVRHENKLYQSGLAQRVGFWMPRTLISSSPSEIREFVGSCEKAIVKPLKTPMVPSSRDGHPSIRMMTNLVTKEEVDTAEDEEHLVAPCIYQEYVPKAFEVRLYATLSGELAYSLYSQKAEVSSIDWRRDCYAFDWELLSVPSNISDLVKKYLTVTGLSYGAFDFVVTPAGEWAFLECNSAGQWGWLEPEDGPVTQMVADLCHEHLRR